MKLDYQLNSIEEEKAIKTILGLDPGRDKCGLAIARKGAILHHQVVDSSSAIATIRDLFKKYDVDLIVMGDGTTSKDWCEKIKASSVENLSVVTVNEQNSTLEARDRYWLMYPPKGLQRIVPPGLRVPPCPVDDIVAILLIERYLSSLVDN